LRRLERPARLAGCPLPRTRGTSPRRRGSTRIARPVPLPWLDLPWPGFARPLYARTGTAPGGAAQEAGMTSSRPTPARGTLHARNQGHDSLHLPRVVKHPPGGAQPLLPPHAEIITVPAARFAAQPVQLIGFAFPR